MLSLSQTVASLDGALPVLVFLFALFVFAVALQKAGVLDHLARWLVSRAPTPRDLPLVLFLGFGALSSILVNDALVLLGVPLLLALSRRERTAAKPLLLTLAYAVTVGSVLTPLGNPQNLLVSLSSGMSQPVATFLRYLLLPTLVNLALGGLYLRWVFRGQLPGGPLSAPERLALFPPGDWLGRVRRSPVLAVFPATMLVIVGSETGAALLGGSPWPSFEVALAGAFVVLLLTPGRSRVLRHVDWSILILFAGLFLVVDGMVAGGLLGSIGLALPLPAAGSGTSVLLPLAASSLVGPQLVSNVPWVALQIPLLSHLGYGGADPLAWVTLSASSTLAGNLTLLGAASNLIVVQEAERGGVHLRLGEFVRHGLPLTAVTVLVLLAFLYAGL